MFRAIVILAITSLSFVSAQEFEPKFVAMAIANDLDAVIIECPVALTPTAACYQFSLDVDWQKMQLESFVRKHNDVEWSIPWTQEDTILMRIFKFDNGDEYILFLMNRDRGSVGFVVFKDPAQF